MNIDSLSEANARDAMAMKKQAGAGPSSPQAALLALFRSIAAGASEEAKRLLEVSPALATLALEASATSPVPSDNYFKAIEHYAYAGDTALHLAAAAYDVQVVSALLASGARVNARNRRGAEPLHYASDGVPGSPSWNPDAQFAVVELLIGAGADPNAADKSGVMPLHRAVRTRSASAVRALLANGADAALKNGSGSTPLLLAQRMTGRGGSGSPLAREQQAEIVALLGGAPNP